MRLTTTEIWQSILCGLGLAAWIFGDPDDTLGRAAGVIGTVVFGYALLTKFVLTCIVAAKRPLPPPRAAIDWSPETVKSKDEA